MANDNTKLFEMFKRQEIIAQQIENDDFDSIYLPTKHSLPVQLSQFLQMEKLHNPYYIQLLHQNKPPEDVYWCHNDKCQQELFYSCCKDKICPKCGTEIDNMTYEMMYTKMQEYQTAINESKTPINNAIKLALEKHISTGIIKLIQEYTQFGEVNYYVLNFDLNEYSIKPEMQLISHYVGDKSAVKNELNKRKYELQFGDVVTVDAYGPHFVGFDENNQPKLIINPCYSGYDNMSFSSSSVLCVPLEITESIEMLDFISFYRLNFVNLFKANGCNKINQFPVSIAEVSYSKLKTLKKMLSLSDNIFLLPAETKFYLQSRNYSYIDTLHIFIDDEFQNFYTLCIDVTKSQEYQLGQQMLSLALKKIEFAKVYKAHAAQN
eukprot:554179_1